MKKPFVSSHNGLYFALHWTAERSIQFFFFFSLLRLAVQVAMLLGGSTSMRYLGRAGSVFSKTAQMWRSFRTKGKRGGPIRCDKATQMDKCLDGSVSACLPACLPGSVPPPQPLFVCQATKLIEIKAGSCWLGIIKSLPNTNKAVSTGAGRGGPPRPVGALSPAEAHLRGLSLGSDAQECLPACLDVCLGRETSRERERVQ